MVEQRRAGNSFHPEFQRPEDNPCLYRFSSLPCLRQGSLFAAVCARLAGPQASRTPDSTSLSSCCWIGITLPCSAFCVFRVSDLLSSNLCCKHLPDEPSPQPWGNFPKKTKKIKQANRALWLCPPAGTE